MAELWEFPTVEETELPLFGPFPPSEERSRAGKYWDQRTEGLGTRPATNYLAENAPGFRGPFAFLTGAAGDLGYNALTLLEGAAAAAGGGIGDLGEYFGMDPANADRLGRDMAGMFADDPMFLMPGTGPTGLPSPGTFRAAEDTLAPFFQAEAGEVKLPWSQADADDANTKISEVLNQPGPIDPADMDKVLTSVGAQIVDAFPDEVSHVTMDGKLVLNNGDTTSIPEFGQKKGIWKGGKFQIAPEPKSANFDKLKPHHYEKMQAAWDNPNYNSEQASYSMGLELAEALDEIDYVDQNSMLYFKDGSPPIHTEMFLTQNNMLDDAGVKAPDAGEITMMKTADGEDLLAGVSGLSTAEEIEVQNLYDAYKSAGDVIATEDLAGVLDNLYPENDVKHVGTALYVDGKQIGVEEFLKSKNIPISADEAPFIAVDDDLIDISMLEFQPENAKEVMAQVDQDMLGKWFEKYNKDPKPANAQALEKILNDGGIEIPEGQTPLSILSSMDLVDHDAGKYLDPFADPLTKALDQSFGTTDVVEAFKDWNDNKLTTGALTDAIVKANPKVKSDGDGSLAYVVDTDGETKNPYVYLKEQGLLDDNGDLIEGATPKWAADAAQDAPSNSAAWDKLHQTIKDYGSGGSANKHIVEALVAADPTLQAQPGGSPHTWMVFDAQGNMHNPWEYMKEQGILPEGKNGPFNPPNVDAQLYAGFDEPNLSDLEYVGEKGGTAAGGVYKDPDGTEYVVKSYDTPEHAENEVLANKLLADAGVQVPFMNTINLGDQYKGGKGVQSKMIKDLTPFDPNEPSHLDAVNYDLGTHAFLGNWDALGTGYDNVFIDKYGDAVYIDPGGALLYRAQGKPKGAAFGQGAEDIKSMMTHQTDTYGKMSDDAVKMSVETAVRQFGSQGPDGSWGLKPSVVQNIRASYADGQTADHVINQLENRLQAFGQFAEMDGFTTRYPGIDLLIDKAKRGEDWTQDDIYENFGQMNPETTEFQDQLSYFKDKAEMELGIPMDEQARMNRANILSGGKMLEHNRQGSRFTVPEPRGYEHMSVSPDYDPLFARNWGGGEDVAARWFDLSQNELDVTKPATMTSMSEKLKLPENVTAKIAKMSSMAQDAKLTNTSQSGVRDLMSEVSDDLDRMVEYGVLTPQQKTGLEYILEHTRSIALSPTETSYGSIESRRAQDLMKSLGFDAFYMQERSGGRITPTRGIMDLSNLRDPNAMFLPQGKTLRHLFLGTGGATVLPILGGFEQEDRQNDGA